MRTITVFKGDGTGPEIVDAVLQILKAAKAPLAYECFEVGEAKYKRNEKLIPDAAFTSFKKSRILSKAPTTIPIEKGSRSLNVTLRNKYGLYTNIHPAKSSMTVKIPFDYIDIMTFHENIEDLYVGMEEQVDAGTVHTTKVITREASTRIIWDAFVYAWANGRKRATCVHKTNILRMSDGVLLFIFQETAKDCPDIEADDKIMDNVCTQLVMRPETFDVVVIPNLYGDVVSDLTSGLIGGLGLLPSSNTGTDYAMFEAIHDSAPDIVGRHIADPTALLWSACMMLEHLQEGECAANIRKAVGAVLMERKYLTPDLHGSSTIEGYRGTVVAKLS